jgi:hypothetical protein
VASPWSNLKDQVFLGGEQAHLRSGKDDGQIPLAQRRPPPPPLAEIERRSPARNAAIVAAYATGRYSYQQIADYFEVRFTTVRRQAKLLGVVGDAHHLQTPSA